MSSDFLKDKYFTYGFNSSNNSSLSHIFNYFQDGLQCTHVVLVLLNHIILHIGRVDCISEILFHGRNILYRLFLCLQISAVKYGRAYKLFKCLCSTKNDITMSNYSFIYTDKKRNVWLVNVIKNNIKDYVLIVLNLYTDTVTDKNHYNLGFSKIFSFKLGYLVIMNKFHHYLNENILVWEFENSVFTKNPI